MIKLKVNTAWTKQTKTAQEKKEIEQLVLNSEKVLDKLKEILYNIQVRKSDTVLTDYDTPSWSHKQAHLNGEQAMLQKILEIVTITEREDQPTI